MKYNQLYSHMTNKKFWFDDGADKIVKWSYEYDESCNTLRLMFMGNRDIRFRELLMLLKSSVTISNGANKIKVSKLFYDIWKPICDDVICTIEGALKTHPGCNFSIVGGSLGGPIATIAAVDLFWQFESVPRPNLVLIGSPNQLKDTDSVDYVKSICNSVYDIKYQKDIFTHWPPFWKRVCTFGIVFQITRSRLITPADLFKLSKNNRIYNQIEIFGNLKCNGSTEL